MSAALSPHPLRKRLTHLDKCRAGRWWNHGMDTCSIARRLCLTEAAVYNYLINRPRY